MNGTKQLLDVEARVLFVQTVKQKTLLHWRKWVGAFYYNRVHCEYLCSRMNAVSTLSLCHVFVASYG
jgi:hypothetical protein